MNAPFSPPTDQAFKPSEESAQRGANNWRGSCVALYARAEAAISQAIVTLHDGSTSLNKCHPTGTRNEVLAELLKRKGEPTGLAALKSYIACYPLRVFLCHGDLSAEMVPGVGWRATLTYFSFSGAGVKREVFWIDEPLAKAKRNELHSVIQKLEAGLARYDLTGFLGDMSASGYVLQVSATSN